MTVMMQLTINDAIAAHLYPSRPRLGVQYMSSLIAVLTDGTRRHGTRPRHWDRS